MKNKPKTISVAQPSGPSSWQQNRTAHLLAMCQEIKASVEAGKTLKMAVIAVQRKYRNVSMGEGKTVPVSRASLYRFWYAWKQRQTSEAFDLRYGLPWLPGAAEAGEKKSAGQPSEDRRSSVAWLVKRLPARLMIDLLQVAVSFEVSPKTVREWITTGSVEAVNMGTKLKPEWMLDRSSLIRFLKQRANSTRRFIRHG